MNSIIPAILVKSRADLDATLRRLSPIPQIEAVQLDVVDGVFASPATWPYTENAAWELPLSLRFRYDLDMMVTNPEGAMQKWVALGAARITLHVESTTALPRVIASFKQKYGHEAGFTPNLLALGLALGMETDIATIESVVDDIDYVQFMGIARIGKQGQPFDPRVIRKIHAFHTKHPDKIIQVDGGVSLETAPALLEAGVSRLVVGSKLTGAADIAAELSAFEALSAKYGVYER